MRPRKIFLCAALVLAVSSGAIDRAAAQFSMSAIGRAEGNPMPSIKAEALSDTVDRHLVNAAEADMIRRMEWHARNAVDFRASMTGTVTQFNKSWTTNNQNVVSGEISAYYYHTYTRDRHTSLFKFDGIYGMNFIDDAWFKNQDVLKLYYLTSWKLRDRGVLRNWAYSVSGSFASQFAEGYKSRTERDLWSNFMAPGTLNAGAGLTYTSPNAKLPFIVTLNPVSADALFVMDDRISDERRLKLGILPGDDGRPVDEKGRPISYKIEGGSSINIGFNRTFAFGDKKGVTLQYNTTLSSFYGWMTQLARHESSVTGSGNGNGAVGKQSAIMPTVGWANSFILNPLRFLSLEFRTTTLYDRSQVDRVQMQYYLRVGLTYRYKNR